MSLLIDTHAFMWFCEDDLRLPASVRLLMENDTGLTVSIASFWEITIKASLGKLVIPGNIAGVMDKALSKGFEILPIEREHLMILATMDLIHRDPFDRIIIAQSIAEDMPLVSSDSVFQQYPVNCVWD